jgi:DNA-binding GntR family transcriptional regulator
MLTPCENAADDNTDFPMCLVVPDVTRFGGRRTGVSRSTNYYFSVSSDGTPGRGRHRPLPRLSDLAADHVRELIVSGQLRPGQFIRPETIADELGISATPAREGLLQLQSDGFLAVEPRRGFAVTTLSSDDITDIYAAQALLAGELTARAATQCTAETLTALEDIQEALERAATAKDYGEVERLNHRFHETIYKLAGARKIRWLIKRTLAYAPRKFFAAVEGWPEASAADHRKIIEHLRAGDPELARAAMSQHICNAGRLLADHLAQPNS